MFKNKKSPKCCSRGKVEGWREGGEAVEEQNDEAPVVLRTLTSHSGEEVWPGESTSVRRADGTAHF